MEESIKNILLRREDLEKVLSPTVYYTVFAELCKHQDLILADEGMKFIWFSEWAEPEEDEEETEDEEPDPNYNYSLGQYKDIISWYDKERI